MSLLIFLPPNKIEVKKILPDLLRIIVGYYQVELLKTKKKVSTRYHCAK